MVVLGAKNEKATDLNLITHVEYKLFCYRDGVKFCKIILFKDFTIGWIEIYKKTALAQFLFFFKKS